MISVARPSRKTDATCFINPFRPFLSLEIVEHEPLGIRGKRGDVAAIGGPTGIHLDLIFALAAIVNAPFPPRFAYFPVCANQRVTVAADIVAPKLILKPERDPAPCVSNHAADTEATVLAS
jgi:hypothetical protein